MATSFVWKINTLERELSDGYVFTAHYSVLAISDQLDPQGNPYNTGAYGSVGLERPATLVPYDQLTEALVIGWVQSNIGGDEKVAEIEAQLEARLQEVISPSKITGVPW
jgi:hypothetical protein